MIFTVVKDPIPFLIIDDTYNKEEQIQIYNELDFFLNKLLGPNDTGTAVNKDGVKKNNLFSANLSVINVPSLIEGIDSTTSWSHRVINTENNSATLISQIPSEGNRLHYHPNWNEWWYIIDGSWIYEVEGKKIVVSKGDIVFIPKGKWHRIEATGDKPAIRLAVSREDVPHIYKNS